MDWLDCYIDMRDRPTPSESLIEQALHDARAALTADTIGTVHMDSPDWYKQVREAVAKIDAALSASPASPDLGEVRFVLDLALEYWAHRQQRYKNRHPRWVTEAKALLAKLPEQQEKG